MSAVPGTLRGAMGTQRTEGRLSYSAQALIEQLGDALAEAPDIETALPAAIQIMAGAVDRPGGLLLLQPADPRPAEGAGAAQPAHWAQFNAPADWEAQIADPQSPLRLLARQVQATQQPVRGHNGLGVAAAVPLTTARGPQGVLLISGAACSASAIKRLSTLGRFASRVVQIHQHYRAAQGHSQDLDALHRSAAALTSTLQLDEILTSTVDGIRQILNVEAGSLVLLDEDRGELIFKKTLSGEPDWIFQYSMRVGQGLVGECIRTGRPLLVNDAPTDPRFFAALDGVTGFHTRTVLCAPLIARGQALGAIEVINKRDGPFDLHDQELLVSMTASVANALYNARLFHQLTVANADLEASRWEVLRSRSTLQALFDGITDPIYIVDRDLNIVAANVACARLAGGDPASLLGRSCFDALHHRSEMCAGCRVAQALFGGHSTQHGDRSWESDGQPMDWEISTYPIRDDSGQILQAIVVARDVTEKRRLEASLAQSEKLAAVGQLAAGVAHEINNPLAAIIANTQLLQREIPPQAEWQESLDLIARAGDRAMRVVRSLLDFARQDQYELAPTDVNATLRSAVSLVEHQLMTNAISLVTDLGPDLPEIQASRDHLQGVWLNLLLNARDALGGERGEIRLTTARQGDEIHVAVADTGAGIPPERLSRIFEPFYTTKGPGHGTGLGLSVCHRIVKQHGGHILVDSHPGQGTTFTIVLPVAASS